MERFVEAEPNAPHDFIVWCTNCNMSIGENLYECEAEEVAEFHGEEYDHDVYLFREAELRVDPM